MTIRIERDPDFWRAVAAHPAVAPALLGFDAARVGELVRMPGILPMAAEHGGFLFLRLDTQGFTCELHTLFTPEGWGREVFIAAILAFNGVWMLGYQSIVTFEAATNPKSRPPLTFGFVPCGTWRETAFGSLRQWILTEAAWRAAPAAKRRRAKCQ
ncbi:MAG TPA: hypothetical protein VIJ59_07130 [Caulobacteraceae bacterium]